MFIPVPRLVFLRDLTLLCDASVHEDSYGDAIVHEHGVSDVIVFSRDIVLLRRWSLRESSVME